MCASGASSSSSLSCRLPGRLACGIPETSRDGDTGLLVPPRREQALASAPARLPGDDVLRDRLAQRARTHRTT